jgi:hypothetical protein
MNIYSQELPGHLLEKIRRQTLWAIRANLIIGSSGSAPSGTMIKQDATELVSMNNQVETIRNSLSFIINPNPVKDLFAINYSGVARQNLILSIYSNSGQLIKQQRLLQLKGTQSFDFSAQPSGVYYAVLQSGSSSLTKKFMKN